jgi:hypothetical protein
MMLYLFDNILNEENMDNVVDENLKTDYGRLQMLLRNESNRDQLIKIAENNGIVSEIISKFSIDKMYDNEYFVSLLFYLGLLTVDQSERGVMHLKIPNYSIRTIYWDYILQLTKDRNKEIMTNTGRQQEAISALAYEGEPKLYLDYISENILWGLSNRELPKFNENFNEKYIKIILLNGLFQSKIYLPITEFETNQGYVDIYMQRSNHLPDIRYEWVWEIKYVKKEDSNKEKILNEKRQQARIQLEKYRASSVFSERNDVRYLSLIFIGKDKYEMEEI